MDDLTGRSQFSRNVLVYWTTQIFVIAVGFVIPRQIDGYLGSAALGTWDLGWATYRYLTLTGIGAAGVARYISLQRARGDIDAISKIYSISTILQAGLSLIILLIAFGLTLAASRLHMEEVSLYEVELLILCFCVSVIIRLLGDPSRGVITGLHRWDLHHTINAAQDTLLAAALILALVLGGGLVELGLVVVASAIFTTGSRLVVMRSICPEATFSAGLWERKLGKELLRFGLKSASNASSQLVLIQTVAIVLGTIAGPSALAIYSRGHTLIRLSEHFLQKASNIFTPIASSLVGMDKKAEAEDMLLTSCTLFMAVTLPFCLGLVFFGDLLVLVWMGEEYAKRDLMVALALGSLLPIANTGPFAVLAGLNAHGRIGIVSLMLTLLGLGTLIPLAYYTVGINYLSAALILGVTWTISRGISLPVFLKVRFSIPVSKYILEVLLKPVLCGTPMIVLFYLAREQALEAHYVSGAVMAIVGGLATLFVYWRVLLNEDTKDMLTASAKKKLNGKNK